VAEDDKDKPKAIKGDPKRKHGTWGSNTDREKGYVAKHAAKSKLKIVKNDEDKK
jgi:hypothetical protein